MVSESLGSIVTQPIENEFSPSNSGVNVVPALVVFHTPPEAVAMYQTRPSRGSTATSTMRPDTSAGPMPRSSRPEKILSSYLGVGGEEEGVEGGAAGRERATM